MRSANSSHSSPNFACFQTSTVAAHNPKIRSIETQHQPLKQKHFVQHERSSNCHPAQHSPGRTPLCLHRPSNSKATSPSKFGLPYSLCLADRSTSRVLTDLVPFPCLPCLTGLLHLQLPKRLSQRSFHIPAYRHPLLDGLHHYWHEHECLVALQGPSHHTRVQAPDSSRLGRRTHGYGH